MKGQAILWFFEYAKSCKCPDWEQPKPGHVDAHVHNLPMRNPHKAGDTWRLCVSWASELGMVFNIFAERGVRVAVVFSSDCERPKNHTWGKLSGPAYGDEDWGPYGTPTLGESLMIACAQPECGFAHNVRRKEKWAQAGEGKSMRMHLWQTAEGLVKSGLSPWLRDASRSDFCSELVFAELDFLFKLTRPVNEVLANLDNRIA